MEVPVATDMVPFTVMLLLIVFSPPPEKVTLLKVVEVADKVWFPAPPKTTVLVSATKFEPVPFHAEVETEFTFNVLDPPFKVPAVSEIFPEKVCVRPLPRLNVPPAPLIVSAPALTLLVKVAVPPVFVMDTVPVVVNPEMDWLTV